jgi:SAM-dependent methyltransferase
MVGVLDGRAKTSLRTGAGSKQNPYALAIADASFDLVHAANSLDHAHDPVAAIKAAAPVVRPGGHVFLEHILNEGAREGYGGLHQWNFGVEGDLNVIDGRNSRGTKFLP